MSSETIRRLRSERDELRREVAALREALRRIGHNVENAAIARAEKGARDDE